MLRHVAEDRAQLLLRTVETVSLGQQPLERRRTHPEGDVRLARVIVRARTRQGERVDGKADGQLFEVLRFWGFEVNSTLVFSGLRVLGHLPRHEILLAEVLAEVERHELRRVVDRLAVVVEMRLEVRMAHVQVDGPIRIAAAQIVDLILEVDLDERIVMENEVVDERRLRLVAAPGRVPAAVGTEPDLHQGDVRRGRGDRRAVRPLQVGGNDIDLFVIRIGTDDERDGLDLALGGGEVNCVGDDASGRIGIRQKRHVTPRIDAENGERG